MRNDSVSPEELKALLTKEEFQKLKASAPPGLVEEVVAMTPVEATRAILELQATVHDLTERLERLLQPEAPTPSQTTSSTPSHTPDESVPFPTYTRSRRARKKPLWKRLFK